MKKVATFFSVFFLFCIFFVYSDTHQEIIALKKAYLAGEYDRRLTELQEKYEKFLKEDGGDQFPMLPGDFMAMVRRSAKEMHNCEAETMLDLSKLLDKFPQHPLQSLVAKAAGKDFHADEKKKMEYFQSLDCIPPEEASSELERKVIELKGENMLKAGVLLMMGERGQSEYKELSRFAQIIELDCLLKMRKEAQAFQDQTMIDTVNFFIRAFPKIIEQREAVYALNLIAEKASLEDGMEEGIKEIFTRRRQHMLRIAENYFQ
ncbi:MAG: hypothetical protein Tsb0015_00090 [Simkaniaceae bacterium]